MGETPEDDVYLTSLFKTKERKLKEAISTLKEYTLLDLTDQKSLIKLKFNLVEITKGKGKRVSWIISLSLLHCDSQIFQSVTQQR